MKTIQYGIDCDGHVISKVSPELAIPILDFEGMVADNSFEPSYNLEKHTLLSCAGNWLNGVRWTRKIPVEIKNIHRKFWGMKVKK